MTYAAIRGWGSYVPSRVLTNFDLEKIVDTSDEWIRERSGISQRHIAADNEATSDLATEAAKQAIAKAGIAATDLDLIILCSASPDHFFPATGCIVQHNLGAVNAGAFDLEAGCTSFLYGLSVGSKFIETGAYQNVLVVGAETLSRFINWQDRRTCVLFGDGAGAVVLGPSEEKTGVLSTVLGADGSGAEFLSLPAGGSRLPASAATLDAGDHYIHMNGRQVFAFAVRIIGDAVERATQKAGIDVSDIDVFIPHQANIRIIQAAAKRLDIPMDKVVVNVERFGNTSSATIPIALTEAVESGRIKEGDDIALVAFGAGLTYASAVVRWGG